MNRGSRPTALYFRMSFLSIPQSPADSMRKVIAQGKGVLGLFTLIFLISFLISSHLTRCQRNKLMHSLNGNIDNLQNIQDDLNGVVRRPNDAPPPYQARRQGARRGDRQQNDGRARRDQQHRRQQNQQQARQENAVDAGIAQYRFDRMYRRAVEAGFRRAGALVRFNQWVTAHIADIDPASVPVCLDCGASDYQLCNHYVNAAAADPVEEDQPVLAMMDNVVVQRRCFRGWVNGVLRRFVSPGFSDWFCPAPRFDFTVVNNRHLAGFDASNIHDRNINESLYCYLRAKMHTNYRVNGVEDETLRLEHVKKLADRWCAENKIKISTTEQVNALQLTIQRAADQVENQTLYKHQNPNLGFFSAWVLISTLLTALVVVPWFISAFALPVIQICFLAGMCLTMLYLAGFHNLLYGAIRKSRLIAMLVSAVTIAFEVVLSALLCFLLIVTIIHML